MADIQLLYNGERGTITGAWVMTRGDTREVVFAHELGAVEAIKTAVLTVREASADDTGMVLLQYTLADHAAHWDFTTDDEGVCLISAADTETLPLAVYAMAVEMTDQNDLVYTPIKGTLTIEWDGVHDDVTTAYPSWVTLGTIQTQLVSLLAACRAVLVTVAGAAGAATVTVSGAAALFSAAQVIFVQISGATYEEKTIDTVVGDVITPTVVMTGAVAVGAVVQLKYEEPS